MPETTYTPFTYLIGWSWLDIWYYGAKWSKGCHPNDLWTNYFTSSVHVDVQRWLYGEPDVIEVRRTFQTKEETKSWEGKVIDRINAINDNRWLNRHGSDKNFLLTQHTENTKLKISKKNKRSNTLE